MLGEDNKCLVYDERPKICRVDESSTMFDMTPDEFYAQNIVACNKMMDEDGVGEEYRIKASENEQNDDINAIE
jgi:Fe-S-cluster containining protein